MGRSSWQRHGGAPVPGNDHALRRGVSAQPALPRRVDYAIIGGGFAGLSTALHISLAEPDARIVVLEAEFVGYGASGRNAGLLSPLPTPVWLLTADSSAEHAWALRQMTARSAALATWLAELVPGSAVAPTMLRLQAAGRISDAGLARVARTLQRCGLAHALEPGRPDHAWRHVEMASHTIDPYATVQGLAALARQRGIDIRERAPVRSVGEAVRGAEIRLDAGEMLLARTAVVCTNAYSESLSLPVRPRARVVHNYMLATDELCDSEIARLPGGQPFVVELNRAYVYYRLHRRRLVYGGIERFSAPRGVDDFHVPPDMLRGLERLLDRSVPGPALPIAEAWAGRFHMTNTDLPEIARIGQSGAIILNVGYGGTGVALSMILAPVVAALARGGRFADPEDARLLATLQGTGLPVMGALRFVASLSASAVGSLLVGPSL